MAWIVRHGELMHYITIDRRLALPPADQIAEGVINAIRREFLGPGQRLPSVRQLATDLGVAANTVVRAYKALENDGWIITSKRRGTFVASPLREGGLRSDGLSEAVEIYLAQAKALGYSLEQARDAVDERVSGSRLHS